MGSDQGAVLASVGPFPWPAPRTRVRVSTHRALHQFMPLHRSWFVALCLPMARGYVLPCSGIGLTGTVAGL